MRLFIAVPYENSLKEVQDKIDKTSAKFTFPNHFHITLKFLGEVEDIEAVKERLSQITFKSYEAELSEIGVFPSPSKINVIWAGVKDKGQTEELQKKIDDALMGIFPRDERFHQHITLARVKSVIDKEKLKESINSIKVEKKRFAVKEFVLYQSTLTPEGPVYDVVERYSAK